MGKNSAMATAILKKEMINALEVNLGNVTAAAKTVNITPRAHYQWLREDREYAEAAENMKDICFRKIKDNLVQAALRKIEKGDTAVLNKMLGIYLKDLPEEIKTASLFNRVPFRVGIRYVNNREEAQQIMRERGQLPSGQE